MARFAGLQPASERSSTTARSSSGKRDSAPELLLRSALRRLGVVGYRIDTPDLPGRPDLVFRRLRVAVFCDGDFWHGNNLEDRIEKLVRGHNAPYWIEKIRGNVARDRVQESALASSGWVVLRYWESRLKREADVVAAEIAHVLNARKLEMAATRRSRQRDRH